MNLLDICWRRLLNSSLKTESKSKRLKISTETQILDLNEVTSCKCKKIMKRTKNKFCSSTLLDKCKKVKNLGGINERHCF